ncbi:MAG: response regulator [Bacteroidota bacterium]
MSTVEPYKKKLPHILLVEDDDNYAVSIQHALKTYCCLDHATTESQALRLLYIDSYDVLLLDMTLNTGYLSGFQFLEYLRRMERFQDLVIISVSGTTQKTLEASPSFSKLNASLTKPVKAKDLIATIERCLVESKEHAAVL